MQCVSLPRYLPHQSRHRQTAVSVLYNMLQTGQYFPTEKKKVSKRENTTKIRTTKARTVFSPKLPVKIVYSPICFLQKGAITYNQIKHKNKMLASM